MKRIHKKNYVVLVIVIGLLLATVLPFVRSFSKQVPSFESAHDFSSYLDERLPILMDRYEIPGVGIALIHQGEMIWQQSYGFADIENQKPMANETIYQVGSISKSVTAWGVLRLVEKGDLNLDDRFADRINSWQFDTLGYDFSQITIAQLLTHTAGLPIGSIGRHMEYAPEAELPELQDHLVNEAVPVYNLGSRFSYSNPGYDLLELLIEEVTGLSFADYMRQEIMMPLGMDNAHFKWSGEWHDSIALGYNTKGEAVPVYVYPAKPSGGLFASVADVAQFILAGVNQASHDYNQGDALLSVSDLYEPKTKVEGIYGMVSDYYGFGYYLEHLPSGQMAVFHGGQGNGWMTHFHAIPETGAGIVILTNSQRSWPCIAEVLSYWASWQEISNLGMEIILLGQNTLQALINVISLLSLLFSIRLAIKVLSGKKRFSLYSRTQRMRRFLQMSAGLVVLLLLVWSLSLDYLFISSVFPVRASWLGLSLLFAAVVLIVHAVLIDEKEEVIVGEDDSFEVE